MGDIPNYLLESPVAPALPPPVVTKVQLLPFDQLLWENFERLCFRLVAKDAAIEHCQPYGVPGQNQQGIDVYAKPEQSLKFRAYQCKREKSYGPNKIKKAVQRFCNGSWRKRSELFVLCASSSLASTNCAEEIERQRNVLKQFGIRLEIWDTFQLSRILKGHPELVADFFGAAWTSEFCISSSETTASGTDVVAIANSVRQSLRSGNRDAITRDLPLLTKAVDSASSSVEQKRELLLVLAEVERFDLLSIDRKEPRPDFGRLRGFIDRLDALPKVGLQQAQSRITTLKSTETEICQGAEEALLAIGPAIDSRLRRVVLGILIRAERLSDAANSIRDLVPDPEWVDLGAYAFAAMGDTARAHDLLNIAEERFELFVNRRTCLAFAHGVLYKLQADSQLDSLLIPYQWNNESVIAARSALSALDPILAAVRANRKIDGMQELDAIQTAITCARIASDDSALQQHAARLVRHVPVPLFLAELALRGLISCPSSLPSRLRIEHPQKFGAQVMSALVERELLRHPDVAFEILSTLAALPLTDEQKTNLCQTIFETSGACGIMRVDAAIEVVRKLQPSNERLIEFLLNSKLVWNNQLDEARLQLNVLKDENDPIWWQAQAHLLERGGDEDGAQAAWEQAATLLPHPDLMRRSIQASLDRRRYESAVRGLKKLLESEPNREKELIALAWTYHQLGEYADALLPLRKLVAICPDNLEYRLGLAQCLGRIALVKEAIDVLTPVCDSDSPSFEPTVLLSRLLESDGRPNEGYELLKRIADRHWDDPRFLLIYVHCAYAASHDREAFIAFSRLLELKSRGQVPKELLQAGTLDDYLKFDAAYRHKRESLQQAVIKGELPWIMAEAVLGEPPVWAWTLHTQRLSWLSDDPLSRASHSVYSTNSFTVHVQGARRILSGIDSVSAGTPVVVDISAVVTLHNMRRLDDAANHYGQLILPVSYGTLYMRDADRFGQHQPTQQAILEAVRRDYEKDRIKLAQDNATDYFIVDEYDDAAQSPLRIRDILKSLIDCQAVAPSVAATVNEVAHKSETASASRARPDIGSKLLVDLTTLKTIAGTSIYDAMLSTFVVCLTDNDRQALFAELAARSIAAGAKTSHDSIWKRVTELASQGKIVWKAVRNDTRSESDDDDDDDDGRMFGVDSVLLAQQLNTPLLADDRVLQVHALRRRPDRIDSAFGTDAFLRALIGKQAIAPIDVADSYRSLLNWRYRFLVVPPTILYQWAKQAADALPGDALLDAAVYLHDCMRDPALNCGPEASDPPVPIASAYSFAWIKSIASFIGLVWKDPSFANEFASQLTQWIGEEFLPSTPRNMWMTPLGLSLARHDLDTTMRIVMVELAKLKDRERANLALRTLGATFGMNEDAILRLAVEAIRAIRD